MLSVYGKLILTALILIVIGIVNSILLRKVTGLFYFAITLFFIGMAMFILALILWIWQFPSPIRV